MPIRAWVLLAAALKIVGMAATGAGGVGPADTWSISSFVSSRMIFRLLAIYAVERR
jgi:hypothetical protein